MSNADDMRRLSEQNRAAREEREAAQRPRYDPTLARWANREAELEQEVVQYATRAVSDAEETAKQEARGGYRSASITVGWKEGDQASEIAHKIAAEILSEQGYNVKRGKAPRPGSGEDQYDGYDLTIDIEW